MSLAALVDEKETSYGSQPIAFNYSTFTEQVASAFEYQKSNLNFSSEKAVYDEEVEKRNKLFFEIHGTNGLDLSGLDPQKAMAESMDAIVKKGRQSGDPKYNDIPTNDEINEAALARSRDAKVMYDDVISRAAPDDYSGVASFIGQAGGWFDDPLHMATLTAGAAISAGKGVLGAMAREAALNAGTEVPIQVAVMQYQKKLGHEYNIEDAVSSVAFAGAMGAGFVGGIHTLGAIATKAGNFSGFTPEQLSVLDFFGKREAIETPPVSAVDSATQAAHAENIGRTIESFASRESVKDLNPLSVVPKYRSPEVNAEHTAVLREFEQSGQKSLNTFTEKKFFDAITEELRIESSLARGNLDELQESAKQLNSSRLALKSQIDSLKKGADWADPVTAVKMKQNLNTLQAAHENVLRSEIATTNLIDTTKRAIDADTKLAELASGKVPDDIDAQLKTFKKNVKAAKQLKPQQDMAAIADGHSAAVMTPTPLLTRADVEERVAFSQSPERQQMVDKEFMDIMMGDPNLKMQNPETGEIVTAKDLVEEIERDEKMLNAVKSCMVGTKK